MLFFLCFLKLVENAACCLGKEKIDENIRMLRGNDHTVS